MIDDQLDSEGALTSGQVAAFRATLEGFLAQVPGAPLGIHWMMSPPPTATDQLGADGHPPRLHAVSVQDYPRRMWIGGRLEYLSPLPLETPVRRISTLADLRFTAGGGGPICLTGADHRYETLDGEILLRERQDIAFRGPAAPQAGKPSQPEEPQAHDLVWRVDATPTLLFRYSALTFNSHRIHYDLRYARDVEHYPDLVVHGPLQATLLLNLAATLLGRQPSQFEYRATAPVFAGETVLACGDLDGEGATLTLLSAQGHKAMTARGR